MMKTRITLGIAGALVALAISLALSGTPAAATQGQPVIAGGVNTETGGTILSFSCSVVSCTHNAALIGTNSATSSNLYPIGVSGGSSGTLGMPYPNYSIGVFGESGAGDGVVGFGTGNGLYGNGGNGVYGQGTENGVQANGGTFGLFATGTDYGVYGNSGVHGVFGQSTSASGVGVEAAGTGTGIALKVDGKAQLSRSGVATVAGTSSTPKNSVRVNIGITSKSMMLATLQKFVSGVFVIAAVPNVSGGYFTIYLNKSVTTNVGPIAWTVIERP